MNVEMVPWQVPNFISGKMPVRARQEGFKPGPVWALNEVDVETLVKQCDRFRASVFEKAERDDPQERRV